MMGRRRKGSCVSFLGMATVAGRKPAQAQVHATGCNCGGGKRGACDVLVKSIAFCLPFSQLSCAQNPRAVKYPCCPVLTFEENRRSQFQAFKKNPICIQTRIKVRSHLMLRQC